MQKDHYQATDATRPPVANSVAQASQRMGLCKATIYTLLKTGQLNSIQVGKRRLIPETELVRFVEQRAGAPVQ